MYVLYVNAKTPILIVTNCSSIMCDNGIDHSILKEAYMCAYVRSYYYLFDILVILFNNWKSQCLPNCSSRAILSWGR